MGYGPWGLSLFPWPRRSRETTRCRRTKCFACAAKNERSHVQPCTNTKAGFPLPLTSYASLVSLWVIVGMAVSSLCAVSPPATWQATRETSSTSSALSGAHAAPWVGTVRETTADQLASQRRISASYVAGSGALWLSLGTTLWVKSG